MNRSALSWFGHMQHIKRFNCEEFVIVYMREIKGPIRRGRPPGRLGYSKKSTCVKEVKLQGEGLNKQKRSV